MSEALATDMPKVETKGGLTPYLSLDGAMKAAEFYVRAFGGEIVANYPPDEKGRTMHVHLHVNDSSLMISDFFEEYGHGFEKPQGFTLTLQVTDIDAWWTRAIEAGCQEVTPPQKMFWGDTYAQCRDPFGVLWSMNQAA
ncbi:MAG: glyoxalase/bleomycin resistance/extradiol dioxygenase family protein [Phenylobacterium sp.]|nr:glyoxalase/bleomycin resistance/extradiol dioxygenase family protein [Phenylobacterium sp.]